jgi:hypothetical protein
MSFQRRMSQQLSSIRKAQFAPFFTKVSFKNAGFAPQVFNENFK